MKRTVLVSMVILTGCVSMPQGEKYIGQPGDPIVFMQSAADMRGTVGHGSGTLFAIVYQNAANECRSMVAERINRPVDENQLRINIDNNIGTVVPANKPISVVTNFSSATNMGGGLRYETKCPPITQTILTEPNGKYLFQFSLTDGKCEVDVFDVKDSGKAIKIQSLPIQLCKIKNKTKAEY